MPKVQAVLEVEVRNLRQGTTKVVKLTEAETIGATGALARGNRQMKQLATNVYIDEGDVPEVEGALVLAGGSRKLHDALVSVTGEKPIKGQKKKK